MSKIDNLNFRLGLAFVMFMLLATIAISQNNYGHTPDERLIYLCTVAPNKLTDHADIAQCKADIQRNIDQMIPPSDFTPEQQKAWIKYATKLKQWVMTGQEADADDLDGDGLSMSTGKPDILPPPPCCGPYCCYYPPGNTATGSTKAGCSWCCYCCFCPHCIGCQAKQKGQCFGADAHKPRDGNDN